MVDTSYSETLAKDKYRMGFSRVQTLLFAQRHQFILWVPVWLGCGIALYFSLRFEPGLLLFLPLVCGMIAGVFLGRFMPDIIRVIVWIPVLIIFGFLCAATRAHWVAAPILEWHFYGAVEGTIVHLDRSSSDKPRITLADPVLAGVRPNRTPVRVRISLHSPYIGDILKPGARIMVTANLSAPPGPVEPGGFDFKRKAWFQQLGAIGYARAPPVLAEPASHFTFSLQVFRLRLWLADVIRADIPGQPGAFAAAIITGDRSQIDPALMADLRRSNLAHLLAISGLHMGLLTGFIFALLRLGIAAVPNLSVRWQAKKIAAVLALSAGFAYLLLSGANVATQRAFVMVAVMLVAILLERPALTLRAVAIAATLLLILRPEGLMEPGFQMSFAATTALVAVFRVLGQSKTWHNWNAGPFRYISPLLSLILVSAVAGGATAPYSAFHFNQIAQYGLLANLLSVPVMGLIVMPAAVVAGVMGVFGLQWVALWIMGQGIDWILRVAHWVSQFEGSAVLVPSAPTWVLGLFTFGALILILWQGWFRFIGGGLMGIALLVWAQSSRPDILITENGRLAGILGQQGRGLNRDKGSGFAARTWLENDGDLSAQLLAALRSKWTGDRWEYQGKAGKVIYVWGKLSAENQTSEECAAADILIAPKWESAGPRQCRLITAVDLKTIGAIAIWDTKDGLQIETVQDHSGHRLWTQK